MSIYKIVDWLFISLTLAGPVLLLWYLKRKDKHIFINYMLAGSLIMVGLITITSWWTDFSVQGQLAELGFNADELHPKLKYSRVKAEDLEKVKSLEKSSLGIGWPVKAIIGFVALGIPYLFTVYVMRFAVHCLVVGTGDKQPVECELESRLNETIKS